MWQLLCLVLAFGADHRETIVDGIDSIPVRGIPGTIAVWGEGAFPIVAGPDKSQPICAGAIFGKGRLVAIAHGAYVSGVHKGTPSSFMQNVIKWVGKKSQPRIGSVMIDSSSWGNFDILMFGHNDVLSSQKEELLLQWIENGGGVIASACPWGWVQVTGGDLQNFSQNRVMSEVGIQYSGNYSNGQNGVFAITSIPAEVNATVALKAIVEGEDCSEIGSSAVQFAAQVSPIFRNEVNQVLVTKGLNGPTLENVIKKNEVRDRLFVTNFTADWKNKMPEDVAPAPGSEVFPGTVANQEQFYVEETIRLDSSVDGWQSTGLYLCPGDAMNIEVVRGLPTGWRIRIGCHKDTLWHKDAWQRWPEITYETDLHNQGSIATPWGGLIYFIAGKQSNPIDVKIESVVEAPFFDIQNINEWSKERLKPAPWAEIKGKHMILTVPSISVRELDNPEEVANFWDEMCVVHCELAAVPMHARPERFVADQQISAGYMHSGYPIMTWLDVATPVNGKLARVLDVDDLKKRGSWGHFHEVGHNRQRSWWTFSGTGEVTCNLFSLRAGEVLCGIEPWENSWLKNQMRSAKKYLDNGSNFEEWKKKPGVALMTYAMLQKQFGWEPFTRVFAEYESMPSSQRPSANQDKMDEWVRRMSLATGYDLRNYHEWWGMPLSESLKSNTELNQLPVWMPEAL